MWTLPSEVDVVLRNAGWIPERKVDPHSWINRLVAEGYTANPGAVQVLEYFGGLRLKPVTINDVVFCVDEVIFDPIQAGSGEQDRIAEWELEYQISLFPVAQVQGGSILCCTGNLAFTLGFTTPLLSLGTGIPEMLTQLVCGMRRFRRYPLPL